ncbi:abortive infection family protein [Asticcacaulis sp. ZE23SCel15]|uniref:abortive infection family protein n=1 Tax=Asticcacaulis sp. ZE23SCel15 TaxID=3059027 RepID=UPI00265D8A1C|nr:abortive infection family protein [Asticcacaulis sp. ZE23SCel15]WKL58013.1 abortive infection family protein [Asticcacaulis sp. ZE23SCel15]
MLGKSSPIPDHILEDDKLKGRVTTGLATAASSALTKSDWKFAAEKGGYSDSLDGHRRFYKSLDFGDDDYEGNVLTLVKYLFDEMPLEFVELFNHPKVQARLMQRDPALVDLWRGEADPVLVAVAHAFDEIKAVSTNIDLSQYASRINAALPGDPKQAIGATKDMLEAVMRTILHRTGHQDVDDLDFPGLTTHTFNALGLTEASKPSTEGEGLVRKIASTARKMILTANELRNHLGTGHGRNVDEEEDLSADDASMVASSGLILAAWLIKRAGI